MKTTKRMDETFIKVQNRIGKLDEDTLSVLIEMGLPRKFIRYTLNKLVEDLSPRQMSDVVQYLREFENNIKSSKGLLLVGPVGTGKSSVATVVLKFAYLCFRIEEVFEAFREHFLRSLSWIKPIRFWESSRLVSDYFHNKNEFNQISECPLIAIDDITKVSQDIYKEAFGYVLRHRDLNGLPTILTSQLPLQELKEEFGLPIFDLILGNCKEVVLTGESRRG